MHSKMFNEGKFVERKHSGGLVGHFGQDKTLAHLQAFYYWSHIQTNVK